MSNCNDDPLYLQTAAPNIEPELRAIMGAIALHSFLEMQVECNVIDDGLTKFERSLLIRLDQPKRLGQLARDTNTLPSTMTAAADQLERAGFVSRQRDPNDRRAWLLVLTEKGANHRAEIVRLSRTLLQDILHLTDDELKSYADIGTKIHANIQLALQNPDQPEITRATQ